MATRKKKVAAKPASEVQGIMSLDQVLDVVSQARKTTADVAAAVEEKAAEVAAVTVAVEEKAEQVEQIAEAIAEAVAEAVEQPVAEVASTPSSVKTELVSAGAEAVTDVVTTVVLGKKWYTSKTLWANAIGAAAIGVQMYTGFLIDPSLQALALTAVNAVLRKVTDSSIVW